MKFLFNSRGKHIANLVGEQLHAPTGQNIGHYLSEKGIFIDMSGRYLGEIMYEDRLLYNMYSPYQGISFGCYGNYGNVGNYGNPGNHGSIGTIAGYKDVEL